MLIYLLFPTSSSETNLTQNAGEAKKSKAELENDASHAAVNFGGYSASSSGAITKDDPNRSNGSWNQTIGSAKEAVGGLVGSEVCSFPPPLPPRLSSHCKIVSFDKYWF